MHYIEHIIEPTKLLLAWQSLDEKHRSRYIVAEINRLDNDISLTYLVNTPDFHKAKNIGFESYPAFQDINKTHYNVLDAFMRRLPPRTRGDFSQYLTGLRLKDDAKFTDLALLGYSGARLPSDGFSIIHPFNDVDDACELLIEAAGYRHIKNNHSFEIKIGMPVKFAFELCNNATQELAILIHTGDNQVGYINRGLIPTFSNWMNSDRIINAWIEKVNGTSDKPRVYVFVKVSAKLV